MQRNGSKNNISLVGFSATGKSIVGRKVAERLGWSFVDIDDEVVRLRCKPIPEIFQQEGEKGFRQLERDMLKKACRREEVVIATGGGIVVNPRNRDLLSRTSIIVCLEAKVGTIYQRLMQDALYSSNLTIRPLLVGDKPLKLIKKLKASRQIHYEIADWTVHTDNLSPEEVASEVIRGWRYINRRYKDRKKNLASDSDLKIKTTSGHYPVYIGWGILDKLGEKMRKLSLLGTANIISDKTVFSIYGKQVKASLERDGYRVNCYALPPGEATKNIRQAVEIYDFLVEHHIERTDTIVALGGGVVGDIAGFVAATYMRGIPWLQVPTTLVSMADASIGGKVAVDHKLGKNLIGAFYQPRLVLTDVQTLLTLPQRECGSGWSEIIKHGLILDANLFELLENSAQALLKLEPAITTTVVARSAGIKAKIVAEDEKETGKRMILNYGHTIAHGLETATGYKRLLHGEAVAIGMVGAAKLSQHLGLLPEKATSRIEELLQRFGLPTSCPAVDWSSVLAAMELDKKVNRKAIRWVLLEDIGRVKVRNDIPQSKVREVLQEVMCLE